MFEKSHKVENGPLFSHPNEILIILSIHIHIVRSEYVFVAVHAES